jgi:hypothetical protein
MHNKLDLSLAGQQQCIFVHVHFSNQGGTVL